KRCGAWCPSFISTHPASTTSPTPSRTCVASTLRLMPIVPSMEMPPDEPVAAYPCPDRRHWWRYHRLLDRLSPGARPQGRCRPARTGADHLGLDLACRRARRPVALVRVDHA